MNVLNIYCQTLGQYLEDTAKPLDFIENILPNLWTVLDRYCSTYRLYFTDTSEPPGFFWPALFNLQTVLGRYCQTSGLYWTDTTEPPDCTWQILPNLRKILLNLPYSITLSQSYYTATEETDPHKPYISMPYNGLNILTGCSTATKEL